MSIHHKYNPERGAAHLFLVLLFVVGLVGVLGFLGYNTWQRHNANAGGESSLGATTAPLAYATKTYISAARNYSQVASTFQPNTREKTSILTTRGPWNTGFSYSPDQSKLAWLSDKKIGDKVHSILNVYTLATGVNKAIDIHTLAGAPEAPTYSNDQDLKWYADNRHILLYTSTNSTLYRVDAANSTLAKVATLTGYEGGVMTKSGTVVYVQYSQAPGLYTLNASGQSTKLLAFNTSTSSIDALRVIPGQTTDSVSYIQRKTDSTGRNTEMKILRLDIGQSPRLVYDISTLGSINNGVWPVDYNWSVDGSKFALLTYDNSKIGDCKAATGWLYELTQKLSVVNAASRSVQSTPYTETATSNCGGKGAGSVADSTNTGIVWGKDGAKVGFIRAFWNGANKDSKLKLLDTASGQISAVGAADTVSW